MSDQIRRDQISFLSDFHSVHYLSFQSRFCSETINEYQRESRLACELLLQALQALFYSSACVDRTSKYLCNLINDKPGASFRNSQRLLPWLN
jgi:hypothetical protein